MVLELASRPTILPSFLFDEGFCQTGGSLLTTLGVFLNSLKMCCLHYRHLGGDVSSWLDRAKENNGGCYSETHVENVKVLARLFPLYGLQLLYRACVTQASRWNPLGLDGKAPKRTVIHVWSCFLQIPSGYYIQTMNSNLHLNGLLLPIGAMNVISILPLLLLAPLLECVTSCCLSMDKSPLAPTKVISKYVHDHLTFFFFFFNHFHFIFHFFKKAQRIKIYIYSLSCPFQLWVMHVQLCRSWQPVCPSCRGRRTRWWSKRSLGRFYRCHPCHVSIWPPSTSYLDSLKRSSPQRVSERRSRGQ